MDPQTVLAAAHRIDHIELLKNLVVGASALFSLMWLNLFFIRRITLVYEINAWVSLTKQRYNHVFLQYFLAVTYLLFVQIGAIILWAIILHILGLADDIGDAALFAGSCYTTMGIVSDTLPHGWKMLAVIIALSGYFAIALTTAAMLGMGMLFRRAWRLKHAEKIRLILKRKGIHVPDNMDLEVPWEEAVHEVTQTDKPQS